MKKITTILWDIDGTLLNFLASERNAIKAGFMRSGFGECTDEMVQQYSKINLKYWEMLERGEMSKPDILVNRFREFFSKTGISCDGVEEFNRQYHIDLTENIFYHEGAIEVLAELKKRGFRQCAVTNGTKTVQSKKLVKSGLMDYFEKAFISDEIGADKPSHIFFEAVWNYLGNVDPKSVMIVGDSLTSDMKGGCNEGFVCCWFNVLGKENSSGLKLDYEIKNLKEVLELV